MKITLLIELVKSTEIVETCGIDHRYRVVEKCWRSPAADELIGIDSEAFDAYTRADAYARAIGEPFPFNL